ncbi:unnamed protein product, partial [Mycena citricolor]
GTEGHFFKLTCRRVPLVVRNSFHTCRIDVRSETVDTGLGDVLP